ncbi:MAG: isoprenylcysteine carboxylmethyltransferase family protein [Thiomargarita sp.]|nr:isoprenylcysteine carboxylmethyltransferase family protein [Thiomargarita sp.]
MKIFKEIRIFSWSLVILQFILLIILMSNMRLEINCWICIILYVISSSLGIWAVVAMKIGNFNIVPDVKPNSILVTKAPYKYIRHPMYSSVLLFGLGAMWSAYSYFNLSIWLMLLVVMFIKAKYEESLLIKRFSDYKQYCANSKTFIPFLL